MSSVIFSARALCSFGGYSSPLASFFIHSRFPGMFVVIGGSPHAIASSKETEVESMYDVET